MCNILQDHWHGLFHKAILIGKKKKKKKVGRFVLDQRDGRNVITNRDTYNLIGY